MFKQKAPFQSTASREQSIFATLNALTDEMLVVTREALEPQVSKAISYWKNRGTHFNFASVVQQSAAAYNSMTAA